MSLTPSNGFVHRVGANGQARTMAAGRYFQAREKLRAAEQIDWRMTRGVASREGRFSVVSQCDAKPLHGIRHARRARSPSVRPDGHLRAAGEVHHRPGRGRAGRRIVAAAIVQNENRATAFRQYVLRTLDLADIAIDDAMKGYGPRAGAPPGAAAAPRLIDDPALTNPIFSAVNVIGADGRLLATTHKGSIGTASALDAVVCLPGAATSHLSVSPPVRSRQLGA